MKYKIMYYEEYETEDGACATIPVEYDGIPYESRVAAWRAFWSSQEGRPLYPDMVGYHVYVKEEGDNE